MAEKEKTPGYLIRDAVRVEQQSQRAADCSELNDILGKSPAWKENALKQIEAVRSGDQADATNTVLRTLKESLLELVELHWQDLVLTADSGTHQILSADSCKPASNDDDSASREASLQQELDTIREVSEHHAAEAKDAAEQLQKQSAMLKLRSAEIRRLQQSIEELEAVNAGLAMKHQQDLDQRGVELLELLAAYDQFQEQSDVLFSEFEQDNQQLRTEQSRKEDMLQTAISQKKSLQIELIETKALLRQKRAG